MKRGEAIEFFGSRLLLATRLDINPKTVSNWGDGPLPAPLERQIIAAAIEDKGVVATGKKWPGAFPRDLWLPCAASGLHWQEPVAGQSPPIEATEGGVLVWLRGRAHNFAMTVWVTRDGLLEDANAVRLPHKWSDVVAYTFRGPLEFRAARKG